MNPYNTQNIYLKPRRIWIDRFSRKPHSLKIIFWILIVAGGILLLGLMGEKSWIKNQKVDCLKWQKYAKEYKGFYLSIQDAERCNSLGILIGK